MAKRTPATETPPEVSAVDTEESTLSVTHTYPDGSAVVGRPPWPAKSPMERAREAAEGKAAA